MGPTVTRPLSHGLTFGDVRDWVAASCAAQGLPVLVTDPATVATVGALLGAARRKPPGGRAAPTAATRATPEPDQGPHAHDGSPGG